MQADDPIQAFSAVYSANQQNFQIFLLVALLLLGLSAFFFWKKGKKQGRNMRLLLSMLTFFGFIIAASTSFFSWLAVQKTGPVLIYEDAIRTPYGTVPFSEIVKAEIKDNKTTSMINPNLSTGGNQLLLIEEKGAKMHVISDQDFAVDEIFGALRAAIGTWREEEQ